MIAHAGIGARRGDLIGGGEIVLVLAFGGSLVLSGGWHERDDSPSLPLTYI
jgi:hypothetical protein